MKYSFLAVLFLLFFLPVSGQSDQQNFLQAEEFAEIPDNLGLAGAFSGLIGDKKHLLFIAGGANFALPVWENSKKYHNNIYVLYLDDKTNSHWLEIDAKLNTPLAYGAVAQTDHGLICLGGHNESQVSDEVFMVSWDEHKQQVVFNNLPSLPAPSTMGKAAIIGRHLYYFGGQSGLGLESATNSLWRLNISDLASISAPSWEILPPLPGPTRVVHIMAAQYNGRNEALYVISGRRLKDNYSGSEPYELLKDVWEFDPAKLDQEKSWTRKADVPVCVMAAPAVAYGQSHIFVLGGADGSLIYQADSLKDLHPGFPKKAWAYHTITDTWTSLGDLPLNLVTTNAVIWNNDILVSSGEMRPRTRSPKIFKYSLGKTEFRFGWLNYLTLIVYLAAMLMVGVYFSKRNKNTNDFFRGGQRIPWWAAACSIFATMLSSLTYMSVPAKAYMTNWEYLLGYPAIFLTAILVIYLIMPFFRRIDATSAYEYLEKRFNKGARYLGSTFFIVFQIGRMAIVMFLSALALAAITPLSPTHCILIMGVLSIIYSTLGGVEAVIWTDTIQTFVLLGSAILIFILIILKLDDGFDEFIHVAAADNKFSMVNWDWDLFSYTTAAFWVIIIGSFGQNLVSYGSDQAVIQRYMTTSDQKKAAKSIITNGIIAVPAGLLFFAVGTALYVFYKSHPANLDPSFQNDAIMPLFIVQEIPAGLAGLIIAGVFAAAQSTISTSMNSIATSAVTDFFRPWNVQKTEKGYLNLARLLTVIFGLAGTSIALVFAAADIKSLLDQFFAIIGLFGGALGGMFLLGMFTRRANGRGAVAGAVIGAITLFFVSNFTDTHVYLYAAIGIVSTMLSGWIISLLVKSDNKDISGLTIFDLKRGNKN